MDLLIQSGFSKEQVKEFENMKSTASLLQPLDKSSSVAHEASRPTTNGRSVDGNGFKERSRPDDEFQNINQHPNIPARNGDVHQDAVMPIAVIGMSCRLPGDASDPGKLWELCSEGRSAWSVVPAEKFNIGAFYHPDPERIDSVHNFLAIKL